MRKTNTGEPYISKMNDHQYIVGGGAGHKIPFKAFRRNPDELPDAIIYRDSFLEDGFINVRAPRGKKRGRRRGDGTDSPRIIKRKAREASEDEGVQYKVIDALKAHGLWKNNDDEVAHRKRGKSLSGDICSAGSAAADVWYDEGAEDDDVVEFTVQRFPEVKLIPIPEYIIKEAFPA